MDSVLSIDVPDSVLIPRLSGRWIHKSSGRSYHTEFAPPKVHGKDDVTGEDLMQRPDDKAEVAATRLVTFHDETKPVLDFYKQKGILQTINGDRHMTTVANDLGKRLGATMNAKANPPAACAIM